MKSRIRGGDAARAAVATTERVPVTLQATDLVGPFQPPARGHPPQEAAAGTEAVSSARCDPCADDRSRRSPGHATSNVRHVFGGVCRHHRYIMLPGMKQRMEVPSGLFIGQTIVLPARFGSVITASSGTSIHSLSRRMR
jgi:hypothetical protein